MRHVPCAGAVRRLPSAGGGRLVAVAKSRMPVPQHGVVVLGGSQAPPALARRSFARRRVWRGVAERRPQCARRSNGAAGSGGATASNLYFLGTKIPPMVRAVLIFACCTAVAACATEQKVVWAKADGRPVVQALLEIDQTDCRDEAQKKTDFSDIDDKAKPQRAQPKADQFAACMAEHGYMAAK
jgi:hypothetical protein